MGIGRKNKGNKGGAFGQFDPANRRREDDARAQYRRLRAGLDQAAASAKAGLSRGEAIKLDRGTEER